MANLDAIVKELQQERDRLDAAINALTSLSGTTLKASRTGRTMSAAARRKIAASQRARWAKQRSASNTTPKTTAPKRSISATGLANIRAAQKARRAGEKGQKVVSIAPKRRISPAGLARIRAATRARWAKVRAGKK